MPATASETTGAAVRHEDSRRTAIRVNIEKLLLLAALTPFVVAGIAQRALQLGGAVEAPAIVATTVAVGAVCAVLGALGFGVAADRGAETNRRDWMWVAIAVLLGTLGLFAAMAPSLPMLVGGWGLAQFGYSGAMALLRTILASTGAAHRRRGSVVLVLGGYLGAFVPVLLLVALPGSARLVSSAFALSCVAYVLFALARTSRQRVRAEGSGAMRPPPGALQGSDGRLAEAAPGERVPAGMLLAVQFLSSTVVAAFLTYHPLDLEQRGLHSGDETVRASALVIAAALVGLLLTAVLLIRRPRLLGSARTVLMVAAILLACSIAARGLVDSLPLVAAAAFLSGVAVGANSSALLSAALETAPPSRAGRFVGAFSAAGALGQFVGPLLGLSLLRGLSSEETEYGLLFLVLACLPVLWGIALAVVPSRARLRSAAWPVLGEYR